MLLLCCMHAGASTAVTDVGSSLTAVSTTAQSYTGASAEDTVVLNNYEQPPDQVSSAY